MFMNVKAISNTQFTARKDESSFGLKAGVTATTALGIVGALACIAKRQGLPLNPKVLRITGKNKLNIVTAGQFGTIGAGAVLGGLLGGFLFDRKENYEAKLRETLNQAVGTIGIPLVLVNEVAKRCRNKSPVFKIAAGAGALIAGIYTGNKASNFINEKIHKVEVDRSIKLTDFAPHVDEASLAISLMSTKKLLTAITSRLAAVAYLVPGIEIGITQKGRYDKSA